MPRTFKCPWNKQLNDESEKEEQRRARREEQKVTRSDDKETRREETRKKDDRGEMKNLRERRQQEGVEATRRENKGGDEMGR